MTSGLYRQFVTRKAMPTSGISLIIMTGSGEGSKVERMVAQARQARGWTQERLAEAVDIEPVTLSRWETGSRALSLSTLARIAEVLEVGLGDLLDIDREVPEPEHGPDETELLRLFGRLEPDGRKTILGLLRQMTGSS